MKHKYLLCACLPAFFLLGGCASTSDQSKELPAHNTQKRAIPLPIKDVMPSDSEIAAAIQAAKAIELTAGKPIKRANFNGKDSKMFLEFEGEKVPCFYKVFTFAAEQATNYVVELDAGFGFAGLGGYDVMVPQLLLLDNARNVLDTTPKSVDYKPQTVESFFEQIPAHFKYLWSGRLPNPGHYLLVVICDNRFDGVRLQKGVGLPGLYEHIWKMRVYGNTTGVATIKVDFQ
jgi:hypothetical protein